MLTQALGLPVSGTAVDDLQICIDLHRGPPKRFVSNGYLTSEDRQRVRRSDRQVFSSRQLKPLADIRTRRRDAT